MSPLLLLLLAGSATAASRLPGVLPAPDGARSPWPAVDRLGQSAPSRTAARSPYTFRARDNGSPRQGGEDETGAVLLEEPPLRIAGTTVGYQDDYTPGCAAMPGSGDVVYRLQPAEDFSLEASLCGSVDWLAVMALYHGGIESESLLSCANGGCPDGAALLHASLEAGETYYLLIDGFAGESGDYVLKLWTPCPAASPLVCGESVVIQDSLTGNAWSAYCELNESGPEMAWSIDFPGGLLEAELFSLNGLDHDLALLADCDPASCLQMPFQAGEREILSNVFPAGQYTLAVDIWNWSASLDPALGLDYSLSLSCETEPCAEVPPLFCLHPQESEPNGGWDDENLFHELIACGDTLCGTIWADGGNRDLDWFRLSHEGGPLRAGLEVDALNPILFLTDFALPDAGGMVLASRDRGLFCEGEELLLPDLDPGDYYLVVSHNALVGLPDEAPYRLWLGCPEDPCEAHEPPQCAGQQELEPNEGWNSGNEDWNDWNGQEALCGTVTAVGGFRDTDWFRFTLADSAQLSLAVDPGEFDPILFLADANLPPIGVIHAGADNHGSCQPESLRVSCLPPGEYYAMVAPAGGIDLPEEQPWELRIHLAPPGECPQPCVGTTMIQDDELPWSAELPAPQAEHQQRPWLCGEVNSAGADDVYELQLSQAMELRITMTGLAPRADEVLLLLDSCGENATCLAWADDNGPGEGGESLLSGILPAGSYTLIADFWGSLESHPYSLEIEPLSALDHEAMTRPRSLRLSAAPNPFNPRTRLGWEHPGGAARVDVYNLNGQRLLREELPQLSAGSQTWMLDGGAWASGVYIVQLQLAEGPAIRRKILLLR